MVLFSRRRLLIGDVENVFDFCVMLREDLGKRNFDVACFSEPCLPCTPASPIPFVKLRPKN